MFIIIFTIIIFVLSFFGPVISFYINYLLVCEKFGVYYEGIIIPGKHWLYCLTLCFWFLWYLIYKILDKKGKL